MTDPVIVFEILSASTANDDLFAKNAEYRATPSIQRYGVLQQDQIGALVFSRQNGHWVDEVLTGAEAVLNLPDIGVTIPLAEIYADLVLGAERGDEEKVEA